MLTVMTVSTAVTFREAIRAQGRTKRWVAQQMGIQETYLVAMLNERKPLQPHHIAKLEQILGVRPTAMTSA